jgi:acyl carrier protein
MHGGTMESIETSLRAFIAENILFSSEGYPYDDETSFLDNGILDSMSVMDLVLFSEQEFGVSIADSEITPDNFDSIERLSEYIRKKKNLEG